MSAVAWLAKQPPAQRRALALVLIPSAIAALLWAVVLWPVLTWRSTHHEWLRATQNAIARDRGLVAVEASIREQLNGVGSSGLWGKLYEVSAQSSAVTNLQADVGSLLGIARVTAQSIAPLPIAPYGAFERIGVRITASMKIDQLQQFFAAVRNHGKLIRIDGIAISAPQVQSRDQNPSLTVSADLYGYQWQPSKLLLDLRQKMSQPPGPGMMN